LRCKFHNRKRYLKEKLFKICFCDSMEEKADEVKISKIRKRDGRIVDFDQNKITEAIWKAAQAVGGKDRSLSEKLASQVVELLEKQLKPGEIPHVEQVQDLVEKVLVENGHYKTAKAYILYRQKRAEARKIKAMLGIEDELKLPTNALLILAARYLRRDASGKIIESTSQMFRRVARTIAKVEEKYGKDEAYIKNLEEEFYKMMTNFEFLPNSPTLMNAGIGDGLSLSACFVIPVEDSIEGIFDALKIMAIVQKAGGGTGFSFSRLRPKGDIVRSTGGVASGPISFMKIFDAATEEIKQGGKRRGANMGILRVDHPDILDFIVCKEREGMLRNFNISVAITDKFMDAVKKDKDFDLINPRNKEVVKTIKARAIWNLIVTMAWKNGEPGVIFIDRINEHCNVTPQLGEIESTNPCVIGNTYVLTDKGWVKAKELAEGMKVFTLDGWKTIKKVIDNGIKQVFKVKLKNGIEIFVTPEHKFLTQNGWKAVSEMRKGEKVRIVFDDIELPNSSFSDFATDKEIIKWLGNWVGDGDVTSSDHVSLYPGNDFELANYFYPITRKDVHRKEFANLIRNFFGIEKSSRAEKKVIPGKIMRAPKQIQESFLRGLFSSDGSVYNSKGTPTIALYSSSKKLLQQVQLMLLTFSIPSTLTKCKKSEIKEIKGKKYKTKKNWRLIISGERARIFYEKIGLIGKAKRKLENLLSSIKSYKTLKNYEFVEIEKIEKAGKQRVYDIIAPDTFTWVTNGIYSLDCGEQPLLPYESCNLGSINLSKMVKKVDDKYEIDWDKLRETVRKAVRFLDNVIDANTYPVKQIEEMTKGNRKIGLGVMGFADMLILLGIPYNSKKALSTARSVMKFITEEARKASVELGKEKGSFPNFKGSRWEKLGFKYMRNATVTTIAPTGSISEIAGCSQGIEPLFAIAYVRNVAESLGTSLVVINPYFERIAVERGFYDEKIIKAIMSSTSIQHIKEIPEDVRKIFVTAHDISPEWHVRMQAAFQEFVDNSISKTINFPYSATPHDVEKAFMLAYDLGCLGITVYRSGSREMEVLKPVSEVISGCEACERFLTNGNGEQASTNYSSSRLKK
jgi:ribonucleoside-diphosphate reductase alpha chain